MFFSYYRDSDASKINYMYAQYVKNTMEPLNIPDVTNLMSDQRFPWNVSNQLEKVLWNLLEKDVSILGLRTITDSLMNLFSSYYLLLS